MRYSIVRRVAMEDVMTIRLMEGTFAADFMMLMVALMAGSITSLL